MAKKQITLDDLASMVQRGFNEITGTMAKKADMDKHFEQIENRLAHIEARIAMIERDIAEIRKEIVPRIEIEDLVARVAYLEKKMGIKSGK